MNPTLRFAIVIALTGWLIPGSSPGHASGAPTLPTLTVSGYDAILAEAQSRLHDEISDEATSGTPAMDLLKPIGKCVVKLSDGTLTVTNNAWIIADVDDAETETDPDRRSDKIDAVLSELDDVRSQTTAKPISASEQADAALSARKLLSSNVYGSDPVEPPSGIERMMKDFENWLNKKMAVKGSSPKWPSISVPRQVWIGLLILLGVFVVGLIGWMIVQLIMSRSGGLARPKPASLLAMTDEEADLVASRSFDKLLDLANLRAETGDFRAAFRLVYLSTLVSLDSAGLVRLNRSRTNWEYLRDLRNGPHKNLADLLKPLTVDFDRIWYGLAAAGRPEFASSVGRYEEIKSAIRRNSAPTPASPFGAAALGSARR